MALYAAKAPLLNKTTTGLYPTFAMSSSNTSIDIQSQSLQSAPSRVIANPNIFTPENADVHPSTSYGSNTVLAAEHHTELDNPEQHVDTKPPVQTMPSHSCVPQESGKGMSYLLIGSTPLTYTPNKATATTVSRPVASPIDLTELATPTPSTVTLPSILTNVVVVVMASATATSSTASSIAIVTAENQRNADEITSEALPGLRAAQILGLVIGTVLSFGLVLVALMMAWGWWERRKERRKRGEVVGDNGNEGREGFRMTVIAPWATTRP